MHLIICYFYIQFVWINQLAKLHAFYEMYINDKFLKWMSQGHALLIFFSLSLLLFKYTSNLFTIFVVFDLLLCWTSNFTVVAAIFVFVEVWNTNLIKKRFFVFLFILSVVCRMSLFLCNYLKRVSGIIHFIQFSFCAKYCILMLFRSFRKENVTMTKNGNMTTN